MGQYYENKRIQRVLDQIESAISTTHVHPSSVSSAYDVITAALESYSANWQSKTSYRLFKKNGIVSEKAPRQPRDRPRPQTRRLQISGGGNDASDSPGVPDEARLGGNPPTPPESNAALSDSSSLRNPANGIDETETAIDTTEAKVKQEPYSPPPTGVIPSSSIPISPPGLPQQGSSRLPLQPLNLSNAPSTPTPYPRFADQLHEASKSIRSLPSRIPRPTKRTYLSPIARAAKRRRLQRSKEPFNGAQVTWLPKNDPVSLVMNRFRQRVSGGVTSRRRSATRPRHRAPQPTGIFDKKSIVEQGVDRQKGFAGGIHFTV